MNGRKREIEIKHDYSLNSDCILNSDELKIFETNIDKGIWIHKNVPIERIYSRVKNGEKIVYKKIEYVFGEVK